MKKRAFWILNVSVCVWVGVGVSMGVGCPCSTVRNDIVTPRLLFFDKNLVYKNIKASNHYDIKNVVAILLVLFYWYHFIILLVAINLL